MTKRHHMIRGGIYVIMFQIIGGMIAFFLLYHNYQGITKSSSIKEHYSQTFSFSQKRHESASSTGENNNASGAIAPLQYSGILGHISIGTYTIGASNYNTKKIYSEDIGIDMAAHDAIATLLSISKNPNIRQSILYYLTRHKDDNFVQIVNDFNFLSKYTKDPIIQVPEDIRSEIDNIMKKEKSGPELIQYLQSMEDKFTVAMETGHDTHPWENKLLQSTQYAYIYNQIHVDEKNRYRDNIKLASEIFHLNPNLIKVCIIVEQLRSFYTFKGLFKSIAQTNQYLTIMSKQSFGIGGMKLATAENLEKRLAYYEPEIYEKYFSYPNTSNINQQRINRLIDEKEYYYQVLYTAGVLYQYATERAKAGYDLRNQPGILATMYNIGYSDPHPNADIGGSFMTIEGEKYSFGGLAMLMYYYLEMFG